MTRLDEDKLKEKAIKMAEKIDAMSNDELDKFIEELQQRLNWLDTEILQCNYKKSKPIYINPKLVKSIYHGAITLEWISIIALIISSQFEKYTLSLCSGVAGITLIGFIVGWSTLKKPIKIFIDELRLARLNKKINKLQNEKFEKTYLQKMIEQNNIKVEDDESSDEIIQSCENDLTV